MNDDNTRADWIGAAVLVVVWLVIMPWMTAS